MIRLKPGDLVDLEIKKIAFGGSGVARSGGIVFFVPFSAEGDRLRARVGKIGKKFVSCRLEKILDGSPLRTEPRCPSYARCGGCHYQHLPYARQLELKTLQVGECLERIGRFTSPPLRDIIPSPAEYSYRGKAEFHLRCGPGKPQIGFMDISGGRVVPLERCEIADESINEQFSAFRDEFKYYRGPELRKTFWSKQGDAEGNRIKRLVKGKEILVPEEGFFQANLSLIETMLDIVSGSAGTNRNGALVDAYCGSGLFSLFLAPQFERVTGIESDPESVVCARENAARMGITNASFKEGRVEGILAGLERIDTIILDPPRTGCDKRALAGIMQKGTGLVIYVSCDPATLARDLRFMVDRGYILESVQPLDMFPQTKHIESISILGKEGR